MEKDINMSDYKSIIENYLCGRENKKGYGIYEMMQTLLLFEISYETINKRIIGNKFDASILNSYMLRNILNIGHTYTQINILGKLFDCGKQSENALTLTNLWKNVKNILPQNKQYLELKEFFAGLFEDQHLKNIKEARDKVICHNDSDASKNIEIDIRECAKKAFNVYNLFNSYLVNNPCEFLDLRSERLLNDELSTLSLPFFADENSKSTFKDNYLNVLDDLGLKYLTESNIINLMNIVNIKSNPQ